MRDGELGRGQRPAPGGGPAVAAGRRLEDYRTHYTADAAAIAGPLELPAGRRAAEQRRLASLVRLLAPRPGERVLDAGCGSGWLASMGAATGAWMCALDLAPQGVAGAKRRFPELRRLAAGDLYHLPFASGSLDAVVLSEVLEHLDDIGGALRQVHRVLRPGGRALVSVPYRERIAYHLCIHCNRFTPANAHLHSFGPGDLERLLGAAGLRPYATRLLTNKALERLGVAKRTGWLPQGGWRLLDAVANRLLGHAAYACVLATRDSSGTVSSPAASEAAVPC
jgi:SAM-dependent methyltransferase